MYVGGLGLEIGKEKLHKISPFNNFHTHTHFSAPIKSTNKEHRDYKIFQEKFQRLLEFSSSGLCLLRSSKMRNFIMQINALSRIYRILWHCKFENYILSFVLCYDKMWPCLRNKVKILNILSPLTLNYYIVNAISWLVVSHGELARRALLPLHRS